MLGGAGRQQQRDAVTTRVGQVDRQLIAAPDDVRSILEPDDFGDQAEL